MDKKIRSESIRYGNVFIFIILILSSLKLPAQQFLGVIASHNLAGKPLYLYQVYGSRLILIDSCKIGFDGSFMFPERKYQKGYYQLMASPANYIELILNPLEERVEFYLGSDTLRNDVRVLYSTENQLLWINKANSRIMNTLFNKVETARLQVTKPDSTTNLAYLQKENLILKAQFNFMKEIAERYPATYFSKTVKAALLSHPTNKENYFNDLDFNDQDMVYSSVFPLRILEYFQFYTQFTEEGFKQSVDRIFELASKCSAVHDLCLEILLDLFDRYGPPLIFQYIVENYLLGEGCGNTNSMGSYAQKASGYFKLLPGQTAPGFTMPDSSCTVVSFSEVCQQSEVVLLVFWSSHCQFCQSQLPLVDSALHAFYEKKHLKITGIAISLDQKRAEWLGKVSELSTGWIHLCDFAGWVSPVIDLYKVHKTPTYYLVNSKKTILAKPSNPDELKKILSNL